MQDSRRDRIAGRAVPLRGNDIDTDRIIPARFLRTVTFDGLGEQAFADDRLQLAEQGKLHPFDDPRYAEATVLFVNKNFGCGSSREHAPQALRLWKRGIRAIVGESFAEIFFGNCLALGIPCGVVNAATAEALLQAAETDPEAEFVVDVAEQCVRLGARSFPMHIADGPRAQLAEGRWDTTGELLANREAIARTAASLPYLRGYE